MADYDVTRVAGNIGASNALNALMNINKQLATYQARLATGKRINTAADDPAGLTIATKMLSRSEGLKTALNNIGDAKNLLAVAESGLGRINDILIQMRNKAEAAASDTMGGTERAAIKSQLDAFAAQIDDIATQTTWNGRALIDGSNAAALRFQTGADSGDSTVMDALNNMKASGGFLNLASVATDNSASLVAPDAHLTVTAGAGTVSFENNDLATGTYSLAYDYDLAGTTMNIQLRDASGNAVTIDSNGTDEAGNVYVDTRAITWDSAGDGDLVVDLGKGLIVTFDDAQFAADASGSAQISFIKAGAISASVSGSTATDYANYMDTIQTAIDKVNGDLSKVGSLTGRLNFKEDQVSAAQINVEGAYNRIMNANMAEEQVNASKFSILQQTATAMLAQANAAPQFLLSLFR